MSGKLFLKVMAATVAILLLLSASGPAFAVVSLEKWPYKKTLSLQDNGTTADFGLFTLDNEVYGHAREDLADLRIIDNEGREAPYELRLPSPQQENIKFPARIVQNTFIPGSRSLLVVDAGANKPVYNSIEIEVEDSDFLREVRLEVSEDNKTWRIPVGKDNRNSLESPLKIFSVSEGEEVRNTTLRLGAVYGDLSFRYVRLSISNKDEKPLSVKGILLIREEAANPIEVPLKALLKETGKGKDNKSTFYLFDLGQKNIPSNRVQVETATINFNRRVLVYGSNDNKEWYPLGEDRIYRYTMGGQLIDQKTDLSFPEGSYRYIKLEVVNGDNAPLQLNKFTLLGKERKVLFQPDKNTDYSLYYGNTKAKAPEYDFVHLTPYAKGPFLSYRLGQENPNASYVPPQDERPWTEKNKWILNVALIMLAGILAFAAAKMIKNFTGQAKDE